MRKIIILNDSFDITIIKFEIAFGTLTLNEHEEYRSVGTDSVNQLDFCPTNPIALKEIFE